MSTKFEVGRSYSATSACNHDCVWTFTVVGRTAKFVTIDEDNGERRRVGVKQGQGYEWALPFGSYSMAPVIASGRPV